MESTKVLRRVERIVIQPGHVNHAACHHYCLAARRIYNAALYQMRQALFAGAPISASKADKLLKTEYRNIYQLLPSAGAQRTIQVLGDNWSSWLAAKADFEQQPEKYKTRPRLPNYAKAAKTYVVNRNGYCIRNGFLQLAGAQDFGFTPLTVTCCKEQPYNAKASETVVADVRIVPLGTSFVVELGYSVEVNDSIKLNADNYFSLDLGIDNLVTLISSQPDYRPVLIKGKVIKSINAKFNKDKAALSSKGKGKHISAKSRRRYCTIADYFHKVSFWLIRECLRTDTGTVVIGLNPEWKTEIDIGRVNNQKFTSIPHKRLIDMIQYKAERYGIKVIIREESYTSQASALDLDEVPDYATVKLSGTRPVFSGRRIHRGLYRTGAGCLINADVNGAINILRKEIGDAWLIRLLRANKGVMDTPIAVRHIERLLEGSPRASETTSNRIAA